MILPGLAVEEFANRRGETTPLGLDHPDHCYDITLFNNFPWPVSYEYNSRGFRDQEWPSDLKSSVWCIGDSFTAGIGSAFAHTWPQVLSQRTGLRTINISMDGASNQWIARRCREIYTEIQPKNIVIMWSFLHRRESDFEGTDLQRRIHSTKTTYQQDITEFNDIVNSVTEFCANSNVINTIIPGWRTLHLTVLTQAQWNQIRRSDWPETVPKNLLDLKNLRDLNPSIINELEDHGIKFAQLSRQLSMQQLIPTPAGLIETDQFDYARDGYHFDIKTATSVVENIAKYLHVDSALSS